MVEVSDEFTGTICSICYEGLKPITEDLQSISICGHVFHELCLQQWFEYSKTKKHTCPVCKQSCKGSDACRLYFQSIGEAAVSQKPSEFQEDAGVLRKEVKLLEVKVSGLSSQLERQGKELEEITQELSYCKKQAKKEIALKDEALNEKATLQFQLRMKSEELERTSLERFRLEEKNMALAKEFAALKLVSDLDLREEDVLKLATLGNGANREICFSGGLLGPDGTRRYLGKWCKRGQNSASTSAKGSGNGDLIAVGADGRGGRIKALRSSNQTFSDGKENSLSSKRLKLGSKPNSLPSKGCLQMEHFFGRVSQ